MDCTECGSANREGAKFCAECGAPQSRACAECGTSLRAGAKFCDECGTPVPGASTGRRPEPDVVIDDAAVRKTVTVLFCDLVGSTAFQESVDPEAARSAMSRYYEMAQGAIEGHGGVVAKFQGDGVMAVFGVPEVAEDDADRAVAAGLTLQRDFADIARFVADRYHVDVGLRVGVNTGEVVIADDDADIVGDALNTAARLEAACTPGRVLVGEDTWRLTRAHVRYEVLGEVSVKGKSEPVATFQVVEDTGPEDEAATPFVGREREMAAIAAAFAESVSERRASLVSVIGAPGVGKTRLAAEAAIACGHAVHRFDLRCERAGTATFAPVAELIRLAVGIGAGEDGERAREQVEVFLDEDMDDRERVTDLLAGLVGVAAAKSAEETFFGVRRFVELLARDEPVVIIVDDVQWAEPLLLDLLDHLVEWVRDAPVLVLALARPEIRDLRPAMAEASRRVAAVLSLDGLDPVATEQLAARLLGTDHLPEGLSERLPESTQGNPLFVRELVRMLVDDGVVSQEGGRWVLTIDAEAVEVPPTIQSLLATRVERMPAPERRVIELAGVIGTEFPRGAVLALDDALTPDTLDAVLEKLRRKDVIEPTGAYWGNEPIHRFHHMLIRDAAYRRLLKGHRAELHLRAGEWTERTAASLVGEYEPTIAFHFEQTHHYRTELGVTDDTTAAIGDRAARLLRIAAERALERDDLASAAPLARRALACLGPEDPTRRGLLVIACEALLSSGDVAGGREVLAELDDVADDPRLESWGACFHAELITLSEPSQLSFAEASVDAAARRLADLDDQAGVAKARQVRARALASLGRVGDCEAELDLALTAARAADDRRRVTAVLGSAPTAALWGPSPVPRAGGRCLDVIRLLRITTGSPAVEATSVRCQAVLEALRGRFDTARTMLESSRATAEELGLRQSLMVTELYAGMVELLAGDAEAAEPHLRVAHGGLGQRGISADAGQAAAHLARSLLQQGRLDEAEDLAAEADALAGQNTQTAIAANAVMAEILSVQGDHAEAVRLAEAAVNLAAGNDIVVDHASACASLARVRAAAGDAAGADRARAEAERLYDAKGAVVELPESGAPIDVEPAESPRNRTSEATDALARAFNRRNRAEAVLLLAPEFVRRDRRKLVAVPDAGPSDYPDLTLETLGDGRFATETLAVRGDDLALVRTVVWVADGSAVREILSVNESNDDGQLVDVTVFDAEDLTAAVAELDTRHRRRRPPPVGVDALEDRNAGLELPVRTPTNNALRRLRLLSAAFAERDAEGADALIAEDVVYEDRRSGPNLGRRAVGRDDFLVGFWHTRNVGFDSFTIEPIAVRGDGLLLSTSLFATGGDFVDERLNLQEVNDLGQMCRLVSFETEAIASGHAELDRLHLESLPEELAATWRPIAEHNEAMSRGDIDTVASIADPSLVVVDHRPLGWDELDRDGWVERCRSLVGEGYISYASEILSLEPGAVLFRSEQVDTADDVHRSSIFLALVEDGHSVRIEGFSPDDEAAARVRLAAAIGQGPNDPSRSLENAAVRVVRAANERYNARDIEGFQALLADDVRRHERRRLSLEGPLEGPQRIAELQAQSLELGREVQLGRTIAIRGDRLALVIHDETTEHGDSSGYWLVEATADGSKLAAYWNFGPDDLPEALAELDHQYLAGEGSEFGQVLAPFAAVAAAINQGRLEDMRALQDPDFVLVDRRPMGMGTLDRDEFSSVLSNTADLADRMTVFDHIVVITTRGILSHRIASVTDAAGDRASWPGYQLGIVRDGRFIRSENFAEADLDLALGRFEELTGAADEGDDDLWHGMAEYPEQSPSNLASRQGLVLNAALDDQDWDRVAELMHPSISSEDRRELGRQPAIGRDAVLVAFTALADVGMERVPRPRTVAVRGDRHWLARGEFVTTDGMGIDLAVLSRCDELGRFDRMITFDPANLGEALQELDEMYLQTEGRDLSEAARAGLQIAHATNRHDLAALESLIPQSTATVDHRLASWPTLDRAGMITRQKTRWELAPEAVFVVEAIIETSDRGGLYEVYSTDDTGEAFSQSLSLWIRDGSTAHIEQWPRDRLAEALARFEELSAGDRLENAATRTSDVLSDLVRNGRPDELLAHFRQDALTADHSRLGEGEGTREDFVAAMRTWRATWDIGQPDAGGPLAVNGDRAALMEYRFGTTGDWSVDRLAVIRVDEHGLVCELRFYDHADRAVAEQFLQQTKPEGDVS